LSLSEGGTAGDGSRDIRTRSTVLGVSTHPGMMSSLQVPRTGTGPTNATMATGSSALTGARGEMSAWPKWPAIDEGGNL
jgi:hypothetical protein